MVPVIWVADKVLADNSKQSKQELSSWCQNAWYITVVMRCIKLGILTLV